ncbi:MAG: hypothetical protein ACTMH4_17165 [Sphingobacterium sp.]
MSIASLRCFEEIKTSMLQRIDYGRESDLNDPFLADLIGGLPNLEVIGLCLLIGLPLIFIGFKLLNKESSGCLPSVLGILGILIVGIPLLAWLEVIVRGFILPIVIVVFVIAVVIVLILALLGKLDT